MQKSFEEHGRWWVPGDEFLSQQTFYGKLSWSETEGAVIDATGLSEEVTTAFSKLLGSHILIQGQLDSLPRITIEDALLASITPYVMGPGKVKIVANSIIRGSEVVENTDQVQLKSMSCELSGLDSWAGGSAIRVNVNDSNQVSVECLPVQSQEFADIDGLKVILVLRNKQSHQGRSFSVSTVNSILLKSEVPFAFDRGHQVLEEVKAFLTLALDKPVVFESIRGLLIDSEDQKLPDGRFMTRELEFLQKIDEHELLSSESKKDDRKILFPLYPLERSRDAFLRFRLIYQQNRTALDFFFSQTHGTKSYINQQFADLVHGLEGIHRGLRGGMFMDQSDYDASIYPVLVAAIPPGIDGQLRQALKKRLEYGNEYSLRRRLKDMVRFHADYAEKYLGTACNFSDTIAEMRNQLAHALGSAPPDKATVTRYFIMLHRVRILFQLELLHHLGFDADFRKDCLQRLESAKFALRKL